MHFKCLAVTHILSVTNFIHRIEVHLTHSIDPANVMQRTVLHVKWKSQNVVCALGLYDFWDVNSQIALIVQIADCFLLCKCIPVVYSKMLPETYKYALLHNGEHFLTVI